MSLEAEKRIEDELSYPIMVAERARAAADEADSSKLECSQIVIHLDRILHMLRSIVRIAAVNSPALYDRPIRRVAAEVSRNLDRALAMARRCRHRSFLGRVVRIAGKGAEFRKLFGLLESSAGDLKWLVGIYDGDDGGIGILSLPPIACNDPIVSWVWSSIAAVQMSQLVSDRIEAANQLGSLALDNGRNKKIIVDEGGVSPLLKLLKESSSPEAQIAAAVALRNLADDRTRVRAVVEEDGVSIIVNVLANSPIRVQAKTASLVARMAENDAVAREEFARANAIRPLVTLLSFEFETTTTTSSSEIKVMLRLACAEALWKLARGSVANSQRIAETKGLLCLAKLVEDKTTVSELRFVSLMAILEIATAAETDPDLRRAAFKSNSHAAKAVVENLLSLAEGKTDNDELRIVAIRAIGCLARTFPVRETQRVIKPLVAGLGSFSAAAEAAVALGKFVGPDNFLRAEHSRAVIELGGVGPVLRLLRCGEPGAVLHGMVLLCCLALHGGSDGALDQARVLTALEGADRAVVSQHPRLKELVPKAVYHLNLYHAGGASQRFQHGSF